MKVLITGSNPDTKNNVAGIGTVINVLMKNNKVKYKLLTVGRKSKEFYGFKWLIQKIDFFILLNQTIKDSDFQLAHINTCMDNFAIIREFLVLFFLKQKNKKVLLHIHGGKYLFKNHKNIIINYMIDYNFKISDMIVVLSEYEKQSIILKKYLRKVFVLQNCIDTNEIKGEMKTAPVNNNILFMGRIVESKGIIDLVDSLILLSKRTKINFHFHLCGAGILQDEIIEKLEKNLKSKYTFYGIVQSKEKWDILNKCQIFILPSRWGEGLPMGMLEAMASILPHHAAALNELK